MPRKASKSRRRRTKGRKASKTRRSKSASRAASRSRTRSKSGSRGRKKSTMRGKSAGRRRSVSRKSSRSRSRSKRAVDNWCKMCIKQGKLYFGSDVLGAGYKKAYESAMNKYNGMSGNFQCYLRWQCFLRALSGKGDCDYIEKCRKELEERDKQGKGRRGRSQQRSRSRSQSRSASPEY